MAKGRYKRRKTSFNKGHAPTYQPTRSQGHGNISTAAGTSRDVERPSEEMLSWAENPPVGPPPEPSVNSPMILRPRPGKTTPATSTPDVSYRVLAKEKIPSLFNLAIREHSAYDCSGQLCWDSRSDRQFGICWTMGLMCDRCQYRSKPYNMYYEVDSEPGRRGRKAATANVGLQVGLTHSSISNTAFRNILMAANIVPPSYSGMQHRANKIGDVIVDLNQQDMSDIRQDLKTVQHLRGQTANTPIPVEGDAR